MEAGVLIRRNTVFIIARNNHSLKLVFLSFVSAHVELSFVSAHVELTA